MKEIVFVATYIGNNDDIHNFLLNNNINKFENCDYYLITNIDKNKIKNNFWNIINIKEDNKIFSGLNKVKISRYFKFNIYETLKNYIKAEYNYYVYCDSQYIPRNTIELKNMIYKSKNSKYGLVQYQHPVNNITLNEEIELIIKCRKETRENMNNTKMFLMKLCNNEKKIKEIYSKENYVENSIIIYDLTNNLLKNYIETFYKLYLLQPTYRDQPLWNFLLLLKDINPIIYNKYDIKKQFYILNRKGYNINDYNKNIN